MRFVAFAVAACLAGWLVVGVAHAQDVDPHWTPEAPAPGAPEPRSKPTPGPFGMRIDLGFTSRGDDRSTLTVVSPLLSASYRWHRHWATGIDWGFAYAYESAGGDYSQQQTASGNPLLSTTHRLLDDERTRLDLWLGVTAPLAWLADDVERGFSRALYAYALATRGLWNPWLWAPESLGAATGASYVIDLSRDVSIHSEGALGLTVALTDVTQDAADLFVQLATAIELGAGQLRLGLRLQGVFMTSDTDALQTALSPYARVDVGNWSFGGRLLLNVDEPLGFLGAGIDAWGLGLHVEGSL